MSEIKLLPCPFCEAELERIEYKSDVFYRHPYNSCILSGKKVFELENDIKAWNTRKPMGEIASKVQQVIWDSCSGDEYKYASEEIEKIFSEVYVEEGGIE